MLDPATGTGTFLASAIELIKEKIDGKYQVLGLEKEQFIKEVSNHILHNFYAFEFMIAPYTVAHLKLTLLLKTLGFDFAMTASDDDPDNDRFKIYLANTLNDPSKEPNNLFGFKHIADEGKKAKGVKNQRDIIAIIGNPPYSGSSQNPSEQEITIDLTAGHKEQEYIASYTPQYDERGNLIRLIPETKKRKRTGKVKQKTWIGEQIEYYKYADGQKLDEKNPKWLQDDYVKFIRFAQYQIDNAGFGTVGYIVPHGFLDNPTFRYMRKSLMHSFSKIYILDLHGNDNKKEKDAHGNKDENVFDIKQGVCVVLFVKGKKAKTCEVYHGDLYGKREEKFHILETKTFKELCTNKLSPSGEMSYFIPRSEDSEYMRFWSVKDIFKINGVGITTAHDEFVIDSSKENLIKKFEDFKNSQRDAKTLHKKFDVKEKIGWDILKGYNNLQKIDDVSTLIQPISYRPFDSRYIIYEDKLVWRTVKQVLKHMLKENLAIITRRQAPEQELYSYVYLSNYLIADGYIRSDNKGGESAFPLYLYNEDKTSLYEDEKTTNFTEAFVKFKNEKLNGFSDEDIFYYIYGLLYSPSYRARYNEFLKTDFPRIDFGYDIATVSKFGKELTQLHLLTHDIFEKQDKWNLKVEGKDFTISFAKKADIYEEGKIYLNPNCTISGVDEATFRFMIGGYQVLDKWLSDRKNTTLNIDELLHYLKIIVSLRETGRVMKEIDARVEGRG